MSDIDGVSPNKSLVKAKQLTESVANHWVWALTLGLAFIALGIVAIALPVTAQMPVAQLAGAYLGASGVLYLIEALRARHEYAYFGRFLIAALALVLGVLLFFYPFQNVSAFVIYLSTYFLVGSSIKWIHAILMTSRPARRWSFLSAMASFVLGVIMVFYFSVSPNWVPNTMLGLDFLFGGAGLVGVAISLHRQHDEARDNFSGLEPLAPVP